MTGYDVAKLADIPERGGLLVDVAGLEIGLFRVGTQIQAWRNHCPHMAAPVCRGSVTGTLVTSPVYEYAVGREGEILQCPWHGWEFDLLSGRHLAPGSPARLRGYPTEIVGDVVRVHLRTPRADPPPGRGVDAEHRS